VTLQPRVEGEARHDPKPSREQVVSEIVERIDAALAAPALVLGSFPPAGRDLELLVRPPAISGLDGAGKSFQARAVRETLEGLVVPSVIEWTPLGFNRALDALRAPKKLVSRPPSSVDGTNAGAAPATSVPDSRARRLRERSALLTHIWATVVVLVNVASHRRSTFRYPFRGRVVIHDRYTCDSSVQLHFWYGESRSFRFEKWLLRTLSPRPLRSFFLNLPPEVALLRKGEYTIDELRRQTRLYRAEYPRAGAGRLDAERLPEKLCDEIAATVWTATLHPR